MHKTHVRRSDVRLFFSAHAVIESTTDEAVSTKSLKEKLGVFRREFCG